MMSLDLFQRVIEQVAPLTQQICLHLMGEPLIHPDLRAFLDVCREFKVPVFMVTNGILLREKQAALLLDPIIRQVCFSLHSFNDNFPEQDPSRYLERIFAFTRQAWIERPDLFINYRLWNLATPQGTLSENRDLLDRIENNFGISLQGTVDVRKNKKVPIQKRLSLHLDTEFDWPDLKRPALGERGTCYGLRNHFGVLADGTVVPCCLDKDGTIALGNLATETISAILQSPRAQQMAQGFRDRKLVEDLCRRCPYISRF